MIADQDFHIAELCLLLSVRVDGFPSQLDETLVLGVVEVGPCQSPWRVGIHRQTIPLFVQKTKRALQPLGGVRTGLRLAGSGRESCPIRDPAWTG